MQRKVSGRPLLHRRHGKKSGAARVLLKILFLVAISLVVSARAAAQISVTASQPPSHSILPGADLEQVFRLRLVNLSAEAETLTAVTLTNTSIGPGTQFELDSEWTELFLALEGGDPGSAVAAASVLAGTAALSGFRAPIAPSDSLILTVHAGATLAARDSDILDLMLSGPADLVFARPVALTASWPLDPPGGFAVDGMAADQMNLTPVGPANFGVNSTRNVALDLWLPPNGYEDDRLSRINVVNLGSAEPVTDIARIEAWADDGDQVFDPGSDYPLGPFLFTGDRWELTGLDAPVPGSGLTVFVTVDVAELAREGRSIRLGLPAQPDVAIGMVSGNDGPIDRPVANPFELTISVADRVTFAAVPVEPGIARPGDNDYVLVHLTAINSHAILKRVTSLTFTNTTTGVGGPSDRDREIEQLILRADGNQNGTLDPTGDPIIGTAAFQNGAASFDGLSWELPAGESRHLFLTGNVSLTEAADGDVLSAALTQAFDIGFTEPTAVAAGWPVDSGARRRVDGMLARQVVSFAAPVATLSGGDGPVLALDLIVPANGYASDELNGLRVVNLGTVTGADVAELRIWRDDGDGLFEGTGQDADLGPMAWLGTSWESPFLAEPLTAGGARIFVSLTVAAAPTDSATVRLAVPVGGIATASGNDGPVDEAIENPNSILLSLASLLSTIVIEPQASTVGSALTVRMDVRNAGAEPIDAIAPSPLSEIGGGSLAWVSGPEPPLVDLAPAGSASFTWVYRAAQIGDVRLVGGAEGNSAGLPRRSTTSASNPHRILLEAEELGLFATGTLPPSVSRGETEIVALNLTFVSAGGPEASDALINGLTIRLEDEDGAPVIPSELLTRVVVNEGANVYLIKTQLENSGSDVDLTLATPVRVTTREPVTVSVNLDMSPSTITPTFRALIMNGAAFTAEDATSGAPVAVALGEGGYPVSSGLARLRAPATELEVEAMPSGTRRVEPGATDVELMDLVLENLGIDLLTSDVEVVSFAVALTDTNDVLLPDPTVYLERVHLRSGAQAFSDQVLSPGDSSRIELPLSPILSLPVNTPRQLSIGAVIPEDAQVGAFRIRLVDATGFRARDATTREPVPVTYLDPPILGQSVVVESPAESLFASGTSELPAAVAIGSSDLEAMRVTLEHPGPAGAARIRCDHLLVEMRDQIGEPLIPATVLDRLRVLRGTDELASDPDPPAIGSSVPLVMSDLVLEAGEMVELALVIDLDATTTASHFALWIQDGGILGVDATSGLEVEVSTRAGQEFPLTSGVSELKPPPRELRVGLASRLGRVLAKGGEIEAARILFLNTAEDGSGPIAVDSLSLRGADRALEPLPIGIAAARVAAYLDGAPWAESGVLANDQEAAVLTPAEPLLLEPGAPRELELRLVVRDEPGTSTFRIGVDENGVSVIQPASALLGVAVEPEEGFAFPMWTEAASFTASTLEESYSNFPNPFAAGREETSFVYYLVAPGRVTLKIWSPRGDHVVTLADGVPRTPGLHESDRWDGRNGRGDVVVSDVFLAELIVDYESGSTSRILRKVAVIR